MAALAQVWEAAVRPAFAGHDAVIGDHVRWRLLYLVCAVEAGLLAAALFVVVIEPDSACHRGRGKRCGIGAVALGAGYCYVLVGWLRAAVARRAWLDR